MAGCFRLVGIRGFVGNNQDNMEQHFREARANSPANGNPAAQVGAAQIGIVVSSCPSCLPTALPTEASGAKIHRLYALGFLNPDMKYFK